MKTKKSTSLRLLQFLVLLFLTSAASAQLRAGFSASPTAGCPPLVVNFTDNSTGNPLSWKWDLGNGTISFRQNPTATYFIPGKYNVKLLVTTATGKDSVVKNEYIIVNALPVANFTASDSTGCFPLKVNFKDSSMAGSGNIAKWQWDFGDGTLSTEKNPAHTYTSSGNFTVILRVTNSNGCSEVITKPGHIIIREGVKAGFTLAAASSCTTPTSVNFINESTGTGTLSYQWSFGDGKTSNTVSPSNTYNAGTYTVRLIAKSSYGCTDTIVKPNAVVIGTLNASFTNRDTICVGSRFQFKNNSTPSTYTAVFWNFGDGSTSTETNPFKTYTNPGTYRVKLVNYYSSCADSIIKTITVQPSPIAAFTASITPNCTGPVTATFKDGSTNATSYLWAFGDGTSSTQQNPTKTYTTQGSFTVSLTATNSFGCTNTIIKENLIKLPALKIRSIDNLGIKGCLPITVSPTAQMDGNVSIASYSWDFGDGAKSTTATPTHTYTTPGIFDMKLVVTSTSGCTDTFLYREAVKAGNRPKTAFSADPRDVCAEMPVTFTDLSEANTADEWLWNFGDGGTSVLQNPTYYYNDTGYFHVTFITSHFGCSDTLKMERYIHVKPPIAKFETAFDCAEPFKRFFNDHSIGATSWSWDFGDGTTSTLQNASHTFSAAGNYQVKLTVSNGECEHTQKKEIPIIKEKGKLVYSENISCRNTRIIFEVKDVNQKNISGYSWYFNGIPGSVINTVNNPVAWSFDKPGTRYSAVILKNILNCNDTVFATVPVITYGPKAAFASVTPKSCYGTAVNFIDSSKSDGEHPITAYTWNYGEGGAQSFNSGPFSHNYSDTGTFNVKLVVQDSYGCKDSVTKINYISVTNPRAKFTASDTALCPSVPITFANESTGEKVSYLWKFGDGGTSALYSPVHTFTNPGTYNVTMSMVDKNGCSANDSITLRIYTAKADFALSDSFSTCPPLTVDITNKASNYVNINWDFGDGGNSQLSNPSHIYTYPGNYTVKLTVKNNGGCFDELTKKVVIQGPTGTFDYLPKQACNPGKVEYRITAQNTVKYVWDFNDGVTIFSVNPTASHTYQNPGFFLPKVILEDGFGCKVAVQGLDTVKVYSINTNILSDTKLICDSGVVSFRDSTISNDRIGGYLWDFGDGTTSTASNPTHNYPDTGFYSVKLITTTAFGCKDIATTENYIKVIKSPLIKILGETVACEPAKIQFDGEFKKTDTSSIKWAWSFGNGQTSNLQKPDSQVYTNSGSYQVMVRATNSYGCFNTMASTVTIHPKPVVNAGADVSICRFTPYTLQASGADSYTWSAHPSLSCSNCATPVIKPDTLVTYRVTGKTLFGCTNEDSVTIRVHQPFNMIVAQADTICKGATVTLSASGATTYQWSPALWLDNAAISSPKARPDTTITYQVVGRDSNNCFRDTQNVKIKVYPIPRIDITNGDIITVATGERVKLTTKSTPDVVEWKWFPSQWLSCASCSEPLAAPKEQITYSVTATNEGNCSATDKVTVNVICNNGNVFIPNTFSPNADGANDVFYPRGTGLIHISSFRIFNRWGQIVFQKNGGSANNPADGWDGNLNGLPLEPDVYVYLIEIVCSNNNVFPFKGNVSLIR